MSMYHVWKDEVELPTASELRTVKSERITVKPFEPEVDGYVFLHGVALASFHGRMYCTWAHNRVKENSGEEVVNYATSDDGGKTWSQCVEGIRASEEGIAVSHGAFLVHEDQLYFFAPQFKGQLGVEWMKMCVYVLDEPEGRFRDLGVGLDERFWPMCEPVLLENGNYLMPGIFVTSEYKSPDNLAAVAISHGSDLLHWELVKVGRADSVSVWGECTVTVNGNHCRLYCREHSRKRVALYAESFDFGRTWSEMDVTNLPMIDSKPYAGKLSTGQSYLICSCAKDIRARNPLTIALTEPGEDCFSKLYSIDSGRTLSYPYAIEADRKLYVAYSATTEGHNRNSAELAIIDLADLTGEAVSEIS